MKRRLFFSRLTILMVATFLLPLGCSSTPGKTTEGTDNNRWLEMLKLIPEIKRPIADNVDTTGAVYIQDHAYLSEKQAEYPNVAEVPELMQMMQNNRFWNLTHYNKEEWQQTMGFSRDDMEREIFYPLAGSLRDYQAILGRFNRSNIEDALKADTMNADFQVVTYASMEFYSAGEDGINFNRRSNIHPLGQATRLAMVDDMIFSTSFTDTMEEMIDAYKDNILSLADLETYQLLASGLIELDAFAALFSSDSMAQSHLQAIFTNNDIFDEQLQREVQLEPYQAYATGAGLNEKGYYLAIVLLNPDKDTAAYNAKVLESQIRQSKTSWGGTDVMWTDFIDRIEVTSRDRLTMAQLYGKAAFSWKAFDLASGYEPLLMYKG